MSNPTGPDDETTRYALAGPLAARLVGAYLIVLALVVFVATALVASLSLPGDLLVVLLVLGLVLLGVAGWWVRTRAFVATLDPQGYRIRLIRGAGVTSATWGEVEEAVAAKPQGRPCVVLRLRDGRTTTIPVEALAGDRDEFARDVRRHLQRAGRRT